jgi:Zn-dependent protease with chaperone function
VIGWIGVFFGRLIQAAVSRQREFLADASSVQFTRNPAGLAGALKKIGGLSFGSKLEAAHAEEASHMFFGNGMGESFFHLMDTASRPLAGTHPRH